MKKIIVVLILCMVFACSIFIGPKTFTLKDYFNEGVLHIYTTHPINETSIYLVGVYMSSSSTGANKNDIIGESLYFNNLEVGSALNKLQAKVKFNEFVKDQNLTIIYAYSKLIPTHKMIKNKKVNLQISTCEEYSVIGWPIIYGSF